MAWGGVEGVGRLRGGGAGCGISLQQDLALRRVVPRRMDLQPRLGGICTSNPESRGCFFT